MKQDHFSYITLSKLQHIHHDCTCCRSRNLYICTTFAVWLQDPSSHIVRTLDTIYTHFSGILVQKTVWGHFLALTPKKTSSYFIHESMDQTYNLGICSTLLGPSGRAFLFFNLFKTDYHLFTQSHVSDKASLADN